MTKALHCGGDTGTYIGRMRGRKERLREESPVQRAARRFFLASVVLLALACRREPATSYAAGGGFAGQRARGAIDGAAYRRGVTRELALVHAALAALRRTGNPDERSVLAAGASSERTVRDGAQAAGLPLERYRRLVAVVDSLLLTKADATADGGAPGGGAAVPSLGVAMGALDSLRIELVVARSLLIAEGARPGRPGAGTANSASAIGPSGTVRGWCIGLGPGAWRQGA
jgi:hypothetical protein